MAYRADISIDWYSSPRIIEVASPSVELTMQDLHDTLRVHEDDLVNMGFPKIVSSSGKEVLDATTKVGITVTLQNAQVSFQARPGPTWTLCNLIGGNLVSVDTDGITPIDSVYPTAYVTVAKTSSASATLQEQDALQYASYGGGVTVDVAAGAPGTEYPLGTAEHPVSNIQDAVVIAATKGFTTLMINGNITLSTGDVIDDYTIKGQGAGRSTITIDPAASILNVEILHATVTGTLDGDTIIRDCIIGPLDYVNGFIYTSGIVASVITLGGGAQASIIDCYSNVAGSATPSIDMGGSGQSLILRGYSGGIEFTNKTGVDPISVDMESGHAKVASSCTAGVINIRGVCKITDASGIGCIVDTTGKVTTGDDTIALAGRVFLDSTSSYSGTAFPHGTHGYPVNNLADAVAIANNSGVTSIFLGSDYTTDGTENIAGFNIEGKAAHITTFVVTAGTTTTDSTFSFMTVSGDLDGNNEISDSHVGNITGFSGEMRVCALKGTVTLGGGGDSRFADCSVHSTLINPIVNCNGPGQNVMFINYTGRLIIQNLQGTDEVGIGLDAGEITLDASNTGGTITVSGIGTLTDNSAGATVIDALVNAGTGGGGSTPQEIWEYSTRTLTEGGGAGLTPEQSALLDRTAYIGAKVYINTELLAVGDGSQATPFNDFNTGKDYAEANGILNLVFLGTTTVTSNMKGFVVEGLGVATINFNGQDCDKSKFFQCTLTGNYLGTIIAQDCIITGGLDLDGFFEKCMMLGTTTCRDGSNVLVANCFSGIPGILHPVISMNGTGSSLLSVRNYSGGLELADCNGVTDEVTIEMSQGNLTLANTCTDGTVVVRGLAKFIDNSGVGCTVVDETSYNHIADIERLVNYNEGTWRIIANQMIYYNTDGSEFMRFDLLDSAGQPISRGAMQRVQV